MPKTHATRKSFNGRRTAVKAIAVASTIASVLAPFNAPTQHSTLPEPGSKPGVWRWSVKTMGDPDANHVNTTAPIPIRVSDAADFAAPDEHLLTGTKRGAGQEELQSYRVTGYVIKYKGEADGDYHVLISDTDKDTGQLLGVEVVRPDYAGNSPFRTNFSSVSQSFDSTILHEQATGSSYKTLAHPKKVTVVGVGFWDETHGQHGMPSGFELHPVIKFESAPN